MVAVIASGCAHWAATPRYGTLRDDARPFAFAHNIELVKVANGLTVALIPDDRTNLATVDMRYDVGAAEDPAGAGTWNHDVHRAVPIDRQRVFAADAQQAFHDRGDVLAVKAGVADDGQRLADQRLQSKRSGQT